MRVAPWLVGMCILFVATPALGTDQASRACNGWRDGYRPGIACGSTWFDSKHAWASPGEPSEIFVTEDGGRRWLGPVFRAGNYVHELAATSPRASVVETGNWAGFSYWTNDGGRFWYATDVFGSACYVNCDPQPTRVIRRAGRGSLLFWHDRSDTLYRVLGWPPAGRFPCQPAPYPDPPPPGHQLCARLPDDAGLRSVPVARVEHGSFRTLRYVPGGVVSTIDEPNTERVPKIAVWRNGSLSVVTLPEAPLEGQSLPFRPDDTLVAAWPKIYLVREYLRKTPP